MPESGIQLTVAKDDLNQYVESLLIEVIVSRLIELDP